MKIGSLLSARYELTGEIGRGGMASVYRARDRRLGREVAIKLISTEGLDDTAVERFQREALLIATLDHPAIVPIYDYGRHEDFTGRWLFFVMPVLPGRTLHSLMSAKELVFEEFLEIFLRVAEALEHSSGQQVVHRDIKPENVMVARAEGRIERVWLMDFGLAVGSENTRLTRTGNLPGTLAYLSPEQVLSTEIDGRSDLYSLGVIGYEFLAGRTPFGGSPAALLYRIVHEPPPPLDPALEPAFAALLLRCLAKNPLERPASGRELAFAVRELLRERRGLPAPGRGDAPPGPRAAPETSGPWIGRARELDELRCRLDQAEAGECQLAMVGGDPGVGKSRLLHEVELLAREREFLVLQGRFSDPEGTFPYQAFCELIQDFFRQERQAGRRGAPALFGEVAADLIDLFPRFAELPEIAGALSAAPSPTLRTGSRAGAGDQAHLYEVLARSLVLLAAGRPLLCLLEGLHAADASFPLLLFLVRRLGATPTFFVCSYRRGEIGRRHPFQRLLRGLADDERFLHLELEKLGRDDHRRLVEVLMNGVAVAAEVADRLYDATDGNPLFTVELVRSLQGSGELRPGDSGQLELADGAAVVGEIPLTLQQALEARLERLPPRQDQVLQLASIFARRCELRDLEALVAALGEPELADDLEELVDGLIADGLLEEERGSQRGDWLRFSSGLLREVAYARIPRRRRRRLHQKVALNLEKRYADRLERSYGQLIHHWAEADVADRTVAYSVLHVRRLAEASCWDDVARAVRLAVEFLEEDAEGTSEFAAREGLAPELAAVDLGRAEGELRFFLARAQRATAAFEGALREGERALRACERAGAQREAAELALFLAETCWHLRRVEPSQAWLDSGLARARAAEAGDVLARLLDLQATSANLRGDYALASAALAELAGTGAASSAAAPSPRPGGVLRVGLRNSLNLADPAAAVSLADAEVLANVFESLFDVDHEGRLVPWLCRSFEPSADGRRYRFTLDTDRRFADGTPFDAERVRRSFEAAARRAPQRQHSLIEPLAGGLAFLAGEAEQISGVRALAPDLLEIELVEPITFFPALLSDLRASIGHVADGVLYGTGPFHLESWSATGARLVRNEAAPAPNRAWLDAVEIRVAGPSTQVVESLSRGQLDVGLELRATEIELLRRLPDLRPGLHELPQHALGLLLLSPHGEHTRDPRLRRVLTGLIDVRELLWRTIARYVAPAFGLLPPEVLGHQPTREPRRLSRLEALEILEGLGHRSVRLRAVTHGRFGEPFRPLLQAIAAEWTLVGLDVEVDELPVDEMFRRVERADAGVDLVFVRYAPDYLDADAFTYDAFHHRAGLFGRLLGHDELDRLCEQGRRERDLGAREAIYRRIEDILIERDLVLPLCRDVAFRVTAPQVNGLGQHSAAVVSSYGRAFLAAGAGRAELPASPEGSLEVPLTASFPSIDPAGSLLLEAADVIANVFETLTRVGANGGIEPLLAEEIATSPDRRRYRFRLRAVRFHDGRLLTTRDVRYSLARCLRTRVVEFLLFELPLAGGADYAARRSDQLPGFTAINDREFELALEEPSPYFLALLSHPSTAIVPEDCRRFDLSWRDGCAGTGPFKLVACEAGRRIELAAHAGYWQGGLPRLERLVFQMATDPATRVAGLRQGRFGVSSGLLPADVEALARDPAYAAGLRRHPSYAVGFAALNARRGPLTDAERRLAVYRCLEEAVDDAVASVGALALRARVLIPPGLPSAPAPPRAAAAGSGAPRSDLRGIELRLAVHDAFVGAYRGVRERLVRALQRAGAGVTTVAGSTGETLGVLRSGDADLALVLWGAPFPDPEAFAILTDPEVGLAGRWVADAELDRCRALARHQLDSDLRRQGWEAFEAALARRGLLLPLFHEQTCWVAAPDVRGLRPRYCWPRVAYAELSVER